MPDFNIGIAEMLVLAIVAILIFGPERLPDLAKKSGRVFRYLRGIANDAREHVRNEFGDEVADFDPRTLQPRNLVHSVLGSETVSELDSFAKQAKSLGIAQETINLINGPRTGIKDVEEEFEDDLDVDIDSPSIGETINRIQDDLFDDLDDEESQLEEITVFSVDTDAT